MISLRVTVALLLMITVVSFAEAQQVVDGKIDSVKCITQPAKGARSKGRNDTFISFTCGLQTKQARISAPLISVYVLSEDTDTSRGITAEYIVWTGKEWRRTDDSLRPGNEIDAKTVAKMPGSVSFLGYTSKVLAWHIELLQNSTILATRTSLTEDELKRLGVPADWYEYQSTPFNPATSKKRLNLAVLKKKVEPFPDKPGAKNIEADGPTLKQKDVESLKNIPNTDTVPKQPNVSLAPSTNAANVSRGNTTKSVVRKSGKIETDVLVQFADRPLGGDGKVYYLSKDEVLHHVASAEAALHFFGPRWMSQIRWWGDRSGKPLQQYAHLLDNPKGEDITPDTKWLKPFAENSSDIH